MEMLVRTVIALLVLIYPGIAGGILIAGFMYGIAIHPVTQFTPGLPIVAIVMGVAAGLAFFAKFASLAFSIIKD